MNKLLASAGFAAALVGSIHLSTDTAIADTGVCLHSTSPMETTPSGDLAWLKKTMTFVVPGQYYEHRRWPKPLRTNPRSDCSRCHADV